MSLLDFHQTLQQNPVDLAVSSLQFARNLAYPGLDIDHYLGRLDTLTAEAWADVPAEDDAPRAERATALAHMLFRERFVGNTAAYGDPRNSFLNDVLEREIGIPISLSVLYLIIAPRLNIPAHGISMPGHFIIGVSDPPGRLLLDPFNGGTALSTSDCVRLVQTTTGYHGNFMPKWLDPTPHRLIIARMLNNLRLSYLHTGAWADAVRAIRHLQVVQPHMTQHVRDEGLVHFQMGHYLTAAQKLQRYLEETPEAPDAEALKKNLADGLTNWARQN